jgi:hypothetical protein
MSKNLDIKILKAKSFRGADALSAHPHLLGHDGPIEIFSQGWMSQWKSWGCGKVWGVA